MRFWDSSALVPLLLRQPRSEVCQRLFSADPEMVVWWGSATECGSAIARLRREGTLDGQQEQEVRSRLELLRSVWYEIQPGDALREQALRLVRLHPLRASDALQLAAAIEWAGSPSEGAFVTFDDRLRDAARLEGFQTP